MQFFAAFLIREIAADFWCKCETVFVNQRKVELNSRPTPIYPLKRIPNGGECDQKVKNNYPSGRHTGCARFCHPENFQPKHPLKNREFPEEVQYNVDFNDTHCKTSGECFRSVGYTLTDDVAGQFGEEHFECAPGNCWIEVISYGCFDTKYLDSDEERSATKKCLETQDARDVVVGATNCCAGENCNSEKNLGLPYIAQLDYEYFQERKETLKIQICVVIICVLVSIGTALFCFKKKVKPFFRTLVIRFKAPRTGNQNNLIANDYARSGDEIGESELDRFIEGADDCPTKNLQENQDENLEYSFYDQSNSDVQELSFDMSGSGRVSIHSGTSREFQRPLRRRVLDSEIRLPKKSIKEGGFGSIFKGLYQGDYVAVKKFKSRDEESWDDEVRIYESERIQHPNIVNFINSCITESSEGVVERWLILTFYERGSLADYLEKNTVSIKEALKIMHGCAEGLFHLHKEFWIEYKGRLAPNKLSIAHRDIKSANILISLDGRAVIADLGLALREDDHQRILKAEKLKKQNKIKDLHQFRNIWGDKPAIGYLIERNIIESADAYYREEERKNNYIQNQIGIFDEIHQIKLKILRDPTAWEQKIKNEENENLIKNESNATEYTSNTLQDSEIKERMVSNSKNEENEGKETFIRNEIEKWRKQKMKNEDLKKRELVPEKYSPAPDDLQAQNKYDEIVKADKRLQQMTPIDPFKINVELDALICRDEKWIKKIGTTRYLAPEILTCTFKRELFSSYHKCDVYSMALVFWEVLNRTRVSSKGVESFAEYSLPFMEYKERNPSIEDMIETVAEQKKRPSFRPELLSPDKPIVKAAVLLIQNSWKDDSGTRLTSLAIKKNLKRMRDDEEKDVLRTISENQVLEKI